MTFLSYFIVLLSFSHVQVDAGHIYGDNLERQLKLRLHKDGKLKYQVDQNEARGCYQSALVQI